jgi:2-keto-3-deoxy-L-rhamnonate aldolase RhmA
MILSDDAPSVGSFVVEAPLVSTVRIAAAAGADFLIFDGEHGAIDVGGLRSAVAMCAALGLDAIVRIPHVESELLPQALDAGARGILAANIETVAEAARLVERAKYPPLGRRGASFGAAQDNYTDGPIVEKVVQANIRTLVLCMIESPRGAENAEAIVAVTGISGLWFGYIDFGLAAGKPGQLEDAVVHEAAAQIAKVCRRYGKLAGVMTTSAQHLAPYDGLNFQLVAFGSDAFVLKQGFSVGFEQCRAILRREHAPDERKGKRA